MCVSVCACLCLFLCVIVLCFGVRMCVCVYLVIAHRRPSGLVVNLHTCQRGSREFGSYQSRICVRSFVTEGVGT